MKAIRQSVFGLIGLLAWAACGPAPLPETRQPASDTTAAIDDTVSVEPSLAENVGAMKELGKRYVAAPKGLRLREGSDADSKVLETVPYGHQVTLLDGIPGDSLVVDHLQGRMVLVDYRGHRGYMFSGYLLQFPMSSAELNPSEIGPNYVESLKIVGFDAKDEVSEQEEGIKRMEIRLPARDLQEAFLVAKALHWIPSQYHFPLQARVVLSTPAHPSEYAKRGPYTEATHTFDLANFKAGTWHRLSFHCDNEVGGYKVLIWEAIDGEWVIRHEGWSH